MLSRGGRGRTIEKGGRERGRGRYVTSNPHPSDSLGLNQYSYSQEEGHWKKECPKLNQSREKKLIRVPEVDLLMTGTEESD